jgi:sensor c-di-GMP phosphodiesterase-like protein
MPGMIETKPLRISHSQAPADVLKLSVPMRNQTAIRLLYVLAVLAGILPPVLFLGYAFRQSESKVDRELDFVGTGTLVRTESVLDTVGSTLRKVASITQGEARPETIATLRQAVFLDRYMQAIGIRRGDSLLCTSEQLLTKPEPIPAARPLPRPGFLEVRPPTDRGFQTLSLSLIYAFGNDLAIEGLINPDLFSEFFDYYARESDCRVCVFFQDGTPITTFGQENLPVPAGIDLDSTGLLQWKGGQIVRVARTKRYPIYTVAITSAAAVTAEWARSAVLFAIAGILVSALLSWLVIRVARRTQSLESDLREAVRYREIDVHYQPIMNLATGRCVGAEALMRWNHPRRGMIPAGEFISVAEKTDLILPMTDILLRKIADAMGPLLKADPSLHIGINLAPQHFASTQIVDLVNNAARHGLPPAQLIFEITERGLVADENSIARTVMSGLTAMGARLAVDDFGTGYSSLSYLQRFPLNYLKVDKAFVDGIESETTSSGLVDQIIRIGRSLDMEIVAEGVEQPYQAAYLRTQGVELAQGWFFARPMPARKFEDFVRQRNVGSAPSPSPTAANV